MLFEGKVVDTAQVYSHRKRITMMNARKYRQKVAKYT